MNKTKLSGIYVHIPFCVNKCKYCDFLSFGKMDGKADIVQKYIEALLREIKLTKSNDKFDTIYIGGGTPSSIDDSYIRDIVYTLKNQFDFVDDTEITIECNPKTVTKETAQAYMSYGINRVSIGLQSTNDMELKKLGRIHSYDDFLLCYKYFRDARCNNISVDLMSAIPEQTIESYRENLAKIVNLKPEHISSYSLIIEEGTLFYDMNKEGLLKLVSEDEEREMYYLTNSFLEENGYKRYEISNYSRAGYESRHNIKYWIRSNYLGFGLGASSMYENTRYKNIDDMNKYIALNSLEDIREEISEVTYNEQIEEYMYLGLRMMDGISKKDFYEIFGEKVEKFYSEKITMLKKQKLIEETNDLIRLTKYGIDVSNKVMSEFLLDI